MRINLNGLKRHVREASTTRTKIDLTRKRHQEVVKKIHSGVAKLVEEQSNIRSCYNVPMDDGFIKVIFSHKLDRVITVLPFEERTAKEIKNVINKTLRK